MSEIHSLLIVPHLRVQNANAISSPMTWGFPSMTAFMGLMQALERKLPQSVDLQFEQVGVVCHRFEPQISRQGYSNVFHLTRNPVTKEGKTAAIVEEGRAHMEITLVFGVRGDGCAESERERAVETVAELLQTMRIAGGAVLPGDGSSRKPYIETLAEQPQDLDKQFWSLKRRLLPGFTLVQRDDLLHRHHEEMQKTDPEATLLDAWLDLSRLNIECRPADSSSANEEEKVEWSVRRRPGWIVPIPVGYGALTQIYQPGEVARARDNKTPFRFVESLYSVGQWISPHRLRTPEDLLWQVESDPEAGLYRINNPYRQA